MSYVGKYADTALHDSRARLHISPMQTVTTPAHARHNAQRIGRWLLLWAASLFLLVLIGGGTRLTESGLSITEWKPVTGVLPPLTAADWNDAFVKYQQIPQYTQMNAGMTLSQFKGIFLWEFMHRFWARFVGVIFALPLLWFWMRGAVPAQVRTRLLTLLVLMGLQGAMGWYMVKSGLTARVNVSQYRLAAHLSLALVIYLLTWWTALDLLSPSNDRGADTRQITARLRNTLGALTTFAFGVVVSGAFVAGLRAGRIYNTFPMMGDRWIPAEYGQLSPAWLNVFENPSAVQFDHRLLAITLLVAGLATWWVGARAAAGTLTARRLMWVAVAVSVQAALGISTVLLSVPVWLGVAHQAGAVLVLTALLAAWHAAANRR
ncbi:MAG: COX15/CtaA family protein [Gemmatimonadetes bacterium]|nr:COX15/CtaA family protein [Gemmatimonadota bacterium]